MVSMFDGGVVIKIALASMAAGVILGVILTRKAHNYFNRKSK